MRHWTEYTLRLNDSLVAFGVLALSLAVFSLYLSIPDSLFLPLLLLAVYFVYRAVVRFDVKLKKCREVRQVIERIRSVHFKDSILHKVSLAKNDYLASYFASLRLGFIALLVLLASFIPGLVYPYFLDLLSGWSLFPKICEWLWILDLASSFHARLVLVATLIIWVFIIVKHLPSMLLALIRLHRWVPW